MRLSYVHTDSPDCTCPLCSKKRSIFKVKQVLKPEFQSNSPAPFVGRFGYPDVNVGILSPPERQENAWEYDAPKHWAAQKYAIPRIIDFRSELVNSSKKVNVHERDKFLTLAQEIGMASRPTDVDISLESVPRFTLTPDSHLAPMGPNARLKKAELTSNPHIDVRVDKAVDDTDLKAVGAVTSLYDKGFDENFLSKLLSVGTLGIGENRKLVPTRWSITATDDMLGKHIIKEIRDYPEADYLLFTGSHLGNYYFVLLFPERWSYELFETFVPRNQELTWSTDFEANRGRTSYAEETAGGYYTVRLGILEKLRELKRQASVLAIRVITEEYTAPLGVWVTREAARNAMRSQPLQFGSKELMLEYIRKKIQSEFGFLPDGMLRESKLLSQLRQTKLAMFFSRVPRSS
ncbi:MAG: hypothetical protein Q7S65_06590 [Nanoarchaeota archaeon]|nr:hypothetical protein [Nanoarchaeota archaeon]